jgi:hypothetical protein
MNPSRAAIALLLLMAATPATADPAPAFLSYIDAGRHGPDDDIRRPPKLRISFGARSYAVVMDTGSTGILVSADKIPNVDTLPSLGPGRLTYSSSGRIMTGKWVVTPVKLSGGNGASITTRPIPVLAVTGIACMPHARRCEPQEAPRGISMMGVGFGREGDHQEQSGPDKNPFLNVAPPGGQSAGADAIRPGYVVTRTGVQIGLTGKERESGFALVKLQRQPDGRDWSQTPVCISVNGTQPAACGALLMDTGVTTMFLTVPDSQAPRSIRTGRHPTSLREGTTLRFFIPNETAPLVNYGFKVGDDPNPMAPAKLDFIPRDRPPFVNTSVFFLNGFDYLFDAAGGQVGFRWTGHAPASSGATTITSPARN